MASSERSNLYKVCLAGLSGVGKTSIFNHIRGKEFSKSPRAETDSCNVICDVAVDDGPSVKVTLQLWDTAGQERWRSLTESYFKEAKAVIMVFSVDCSESFQEVDKEVKRIIRNDFSTDALYFLVGNKVDLKSDDVSQARINDCQRSNPDVFCSYTRTSAKEGTNVRRLFDDIAQTLVSKRVSPVKKGAGFQPYYQQPEKRNCCWL